MEVGPTLMRRDGHERIRDLTPPARRSSVLRSPGGRSFIWQSLSTGQLFAVNSIRFVAIRSDRFQKTVEKCLRLEPDNLPSAIGNFIRNRHLFSIRLRG
jgi:hypothetical protein